MKRVLSIWLGLMLMMGLSCAAAEEWFDVYAGAVIGKTMYGITEDLQLISKKAGDEEHAVLGRLDKVTRTEGETADSGADLALLNIGGELHALSLTSGQVYALLEDGRLHIEKKESLGCDLTGITVEENGERLPTNIVSLFADGAKLYFAVESYEEDSSVYTAGRFDLKTGERKDFDTERIASLTQDEGGRMYALLVNPAEMAEVDPETMTVEKTAAVENAQSYQLYDITASDGKVYFESDNQIFEINPTSGQVMRAAYPGYAHLLRSEYADIVRNGLYVRFGDGIDPIALNQEQAASQNVLNVLSAGGEGQKQFAKNHPEIPVLPQEYVPMSAETADQTAAQSGCDVVLLSSESNDLQLLSKEGPFLDLLQSKDIAAMTETLEPALLEALTEGGKLLMMPETIRGSGLSVDLLAMQKLGLSQESLPASMEELLVLVRDFDKTYGENESGVLLGTAADKYELFHMLIDSYLMRCEQRGEAVMFDTPEFRKLADVFDSIDFEALADQYSYENALFTGVETIQFSLQDKRPHTKLLPLGFLKGEEGAFRVEVSGLAATDAYGQGENALLYIAENQKYLTEDDRIALYVNADKPVKDEAVIEEMNSKSGQMCAVRKSVVTSLDKEKTMAQFMETRDSLFDMDEQMYRISPENIAYYRNEIAPKLVVSKRRAERTKVFETKADETVSYLDGMISSDEWIGAMSGEASADETDEQMPVFVSDVMIGDSIYGMDLDRLLYRVDPDDGRMEMLGFFDGDLSNDEAFQFRLLNIEDRLHVIKMTTGDIYSIGDKFEIVLREDLHADKALLKAKDQYVQRLFMMGDELYFVVWDENNQPFGGKTDLLSGKTALFGSDTPVNALTKDEKGQLYAVREQSEIVQIDAESGQVLKTIPAPFLAQELDVSIAETLTVSGGYGYVHNEEIIQVDLETGESLVTGHTGYPHLYYGALQPPFFRNGKLLYLGSYGFESFDIMTDTAHPLTVCGYDTGAHIAVVKAHPELGIAYTFKTWETASAPLGDVGLYNAAVDDLKLMTENGLLADLAEDTELSETILAYGEKLYAPVSRDGKKCGLLVSASAYDSFAVSHAAMDALELTAGDLPHSMEEMLEMAAGWNERFGEKSAAAPGALGEKDVMLSTLFEMYLSELEKQGKPLAFDTDEFRRLMTLYESIDFDFLSALNEGTIYGTEALTDGTRLFENLDAVYFALANETKGASLLPISCMKGQEAFYPVRAEYLCADANGQKDKAISYIKAYQKETTVLPAVTGQGAEESFLPYAYVTEGTMRKGNKNSDLLEKLYLYLYAPEGEKISLENLTEQLDDVIVSDGKDELF